MIAQLIRRDPSLRHLLWAIPVFALAGALLSVSYGERSLLDSTAVRWEYAIVLTIECGVWYFILGRLHMRADSPYLALPISTKSLWIARMAVILATTMLPVIAAFAAFQATAGFDLASPRVEFGLNFLAVLALLPFFFHCRPSTSQRPDATHSAIHWIAFAMIAFGSQIAVAVLSPPFTIVGPVAVIVAVVIAIAVLRSLPGGFEIAPRRARIGSGSGRFLPAGWGRVLPLLNPVAPLSRMLRIHILMSLNLVSVLAGFAMWSVMSIGRGMYIELYALIFFQVILFFLTLTALPRVAHLPIAPSRLLAQGVVPGLVILAGILGIAFAGEGAPTFGTILASRAAVVGAALYVIAWFLVMSFVLVMFRTPAATARGRMFGRLGKIALGLVASATIVAILAPMWGDPRESAKEIQAHFVNIGEYLPAFGVVNWLVVILLAIAAYAVVLAMFRRVEFHWLAKRLVKTMERLG